jgi:hypothetical protein
VAAWEVFAKSHHVQEGCAMPKDDDKVNDQKVVLWDTSETPLSRFWEKGPLVLVFLRHYG